MKLLVDVGNTALKLALYQAGKITFIEQQALDWQSITQVLIASVRANAKLDQLITNAKANNVKTIYLV